MAMQGQPRALDPAIAEVSELRDYWVLLKPNVMSLVVFSGAVGLYLAPCSLHPLLALTALRCIAVCAAACG
jgi:protoheme IX farnesyltransferase